MARSLCQRRSTRSTTGERGELARRIDALTLELEDLRRREPATPERYAKEQTLEQLRWRFARVARRFAQDDLGAAA